ncbi:MAG: hypothetical protein RL398_1709 [Planctomycetota bacterium]|jgi:5-formyltetrahydrofolate cyclo-ligase
MSGSAWRKEARASLVAQRMAVGSEIRRRVVDAVGDVLKALLQDRRGRGLRTEIAFYWPIRGEIGLRAAIEPLLAEDVGAALPFIPGRDCALQFRRWRPGCEMVAGVWNIPTPAVDERIVPNVLLVPLVGFDAARHRLGNGGGYYDRTLAALPPETLAIGIGFDCLRLPTIHPEPHDVPMSMVVTESTSACGGQRR